MNIPCEQIQQLNAQAWSDRNKDAQRSLQLAQHVQDMLADCPEAGIHELVVNLRTQSYCLEQLSRFDEALAIGLKAMELAGNLGDLSMIAQLDNILGYVYWRLADYSTALGHFIHGLELVHQEPDPELEVFLLQGLGAVHHLRGEYEEALLYFKRSSESDLLENGIGRAIGWNNIAYTLHELGRNDEALTYALQALELFGQDKLSVGRLEALHTLGSIYLQQGELDQARCYFEEGIRAAEQQGNTLQKVETLLGLCRMHQRMGELETARQTLLQTLTLSKEIGSLSSQCSAHEMLAKLYKQMGNFRSALDHYEEFHTLHVRMFNQQSEQRLHSTRMLYEVETIRKQADLYRTLAATDMLTGLLSRREFMELGTKTMFHAQTRKAPVSLLMIDLDSFKPINDQYGHAVGDQVLAAVATRLKQSLRQDDLAGRYGGDECVVLMPDIGGRECLKIAERCRRVIAEEAIEVGELKLRTSISVGLSVLEGENPVRLEDLIQRADEALLSAKKNGRNRIVGPAS